MNSSKSANTSFNNPLSPRSHTKSVFKRINEWVEKHFRTDRNRINDSSPFSEFPVDSPLSVTSSQSKLRNSRTPTSSKKGSLSLRHQLLKTVSDSRDDAETDSCGESNEGSRKLMSPPTSAFSSKDPSQTLSAKFSPVESISFTPTPPHLAMNLSVKLNLPPSTQTRFRSSRKVRALDSFDHRKSPQFTKLPSPRRAAPERIVSGESSKFIPSVTIASKRQLAQVKEAAQKNSAQLIQQLSLELAQEENRLSAVAEEDAQSPPDSPRPPSPRPLSPRLFRPRTDSPQSAESTPSKDTTRESVDSSVDEAMAFSSKKNAEQFAESFHMEETFPLGDDSFVYSLQPPEEGERVVLRTLHDRIQTVLDSRTGAATFLAFTQKRLSDRELVFLQGSYAALLADPDYVKYLAKRITERYMAPRRLFPLLKDLKGLEEAYMFAGFQTVSRLFKELVKMGTMSSLSLFILQSPEYKQWLLAEKMGDLTSRPRIPRRLSDPVTPALSPPPACDLPITRVIAPVSLPVSPISPATPLSPASPTGRRYTLPSATPTRTLVARLESVPLYTPPPAPSPVDRSQEDELDRRMREQAYYEEVMGQPKTSIVDKVTNAMQNKFLHRLLRSERWVSSLLQMAENLPVSIMLLRATREFPVMYMNPAFCASYGHDAREWIGESYLSVLLQLQNPTLTSLQHAHKFGPLVGEALVSAKKFEFMFYTYCAGDALVPALAAMKPIFDHTGEYKFVLVCMLNLNVPGSSNYTNIVLMDHVFQLFPDNIVTCDAEIESLL